MTKKKASKVVKTKKAVKKAKPLKKVNTIPEPTAAPIDLGQDDFNYERLTPASKEALTVFILGRRQKPTNKIIKGIASFMGFISKLVLSVLLVIFKFLLMLTLAILILASMVFLVQKLQYFGSYEMIKKVFITGGIGLICIMIITGFLLEVKSAYTYISSKFNRGAK